MAFVTSCHWLNSAVEEILPTLRDPGTQWMVLVCCGAYFITFSLLRFTSLSSDLGQVDHPALWVGGLLAVAGLHYAFSYGRASASTEAFVLVAGAAVGKGAAVWTTWKSRKLKADSGNVEHPTLNIQRSAFNRANAVIEILVLLLAAAVFMGNEAGMRFQYRGQSRWSGPWDNPNVFGMLMGVGMVLAVGRVVSGFKFQVSRRGIQKAESSEAKAESRKLKAEILRWGKAIFFVAAAVVCGIGLVKSYSRGAWMGAACGLGYLGWQFLRRQKEECRTLKVEGSPDKSETGNRKSEVSEAKTHLTPALSPHPMGGEGGFHSLQSCNSRGVLWLRRNWVPLGVLLASLAALGFWSFRHTERVVARRAFSVGNVNDFSWRNRVSAYKGALQMMADRPWFGFGWNQPTRVYDQYYRDAKVSESAAFQLNDYFTLGTSLGVPALICFLAYVGLALRRNAECRMQDGEFWSTVTRNVSLGAVCHAGAIVLLVGFWFDGGLFRFATASVFWIVMELGREESPRITRMHTNE